MLLIPHPFYVGVAEVAYDQDDQRVEVAVKLFTDDLERALRETYQAPVLNISGMNEHENTDSLIQKYLERNFHLRIHNEAIPLRYLGKEANADATWIYIFFPVEEEPQSANISFTAFFELFAGQRNLIHLKTYEVTTSICVPYAPSVSVAFR